MARQLPDELGRLTVEEAPSWQALWQARLAPIAASIPNDPPGPGNPLWIDAIRKGRKASRMIGNLPDPGVKWEGENRLAWTKQYELAAELIDGAREALANMQAPGTGRLVN